MTRRRINCFVCTCVREKVSFLSAFSPMWYMQRLCKISSMYVDCKEVFSSIFYLSVENINLLFSKLTADLELWKWFSDGIFLCKLNEFIFSLPLSQIISLMRVLSTNQTLLLCKMTAAAQYKLQKLHNGQSAEQPSCRKSCSTIIRQRKTVRQVYNEIGRMMFRRAYRMHIETFYKLYKLIKPVLIQICKYTYPIKLDTLMTGFSETKRCRLQKKLKRLREDVNILEKKRKRCEVSEMN